MSTNKSAQQRAEVAETPSDHVVEYEGYEYKIPPTSEWSIDITEALEDGNSTIAVRAMLGSQWQLFKQRHARASNVGAFLDAAGKVLGTGNR